MNIDNIKLSGGENISLTAYIPDISDEMSNMKVKPAVLIFPGGAYKFCSDREAEPIALMFVANGYNAFILRYSLNEDSAFPKPLNDANEAFDLIVSNSEKWHTDPNRIAVCGFSAGGHLAAALSIFGNRRPAACILGYQCILDSVSDILAKPIQSLDDKVDELTPPTFIFAASDDNTVPICNSLRYAQALDAHKVPFELHVFNSGGHGFSLANEIVFSNDESLIIAKRTEEWLNMCLTWLKEIL